MIKKIIFIIVGIYLFLLVGLFFFQENIIFQSKKLDNSFTYAFNNNFEEVNLKTEDNSIINALHFKVKNPKGVILYFHGNKGSLDRWGAITSSYTDFGYDVFVMDYRGYGKSTGNRNEKNLYNDALLCYNHIKKSYEENDIILYGRSLGCTFATYIASNQNPKKLILEAPFYNLANTANSHYPFLPTFLLKYKFPTNEFIPKVTCHVTIFHGTEDKVTPYNGGRKLFEAVAVATKEFVSIENATHHNLANFELYKNKIKALLD